MPDGPPTIDLSGLADAISRSLLDHLGDLGTAIWDDLSHWLYAMLRDLALTLWHVVASHPRRWLTVMTYALASWSADPTRDQLARAGTCRPATGRAPRPRSAPASGHPHRPTLVGRRGQQLRCPRWVRGPFRLARWMCPKSRATSSERRCPQPRSTGSRAWSSRLAGGALHCTRTWRWRWRCGGAARDGCNRARDAAPAEFETRSNAHAAARPLGGFR